MKSNIKTLGEITSYISKGIVPKYTLESGKNTISSTKDAIEITK